MRTILLSAAFLLTAISAFSQKIRTNTSNDADSMECVTSLSLYIEFFKQENYTDAMLGWRKASKICPKSAESLWINGAKLYNGLIEKETDEAKKQLLVDTLLWVYDQRIEHFGKEGYVMGRKGVDLYRHRPQAAQLTYDLLSRCQTLEMEKMEPTAVQYWFKSAYDLYKKNNLTDMVLFDVYAQASEINAANASGKQAENYKKIQDNLDNWIANVADCDKLVEIFEPKFKANPTDAKLIGQITKLLDKQKCSDENLYLEVAVAAYKLNPSPAAAFDIGKAYYAKDNYSESLRYCKEACASDASETVYSANKYAALSALQLGQAQSAKTYALRMLEVNSNSGEAYIIIGNAYAKGRSDCGGDECRNRAAYWAAVDKFQKAKAVDPSVADQAQQLINTFSAQFPKKADCFFHSINDGSSYTLDCWIGETTTVRTIDN